MSQTENNMVSGLAGALCDLAKYTTPTLEEEGSRLRQVVVARDYAGDETTYTDWATAKFSQSSYPLLAEVLWLRAQTLPSNDIQPSKYPG